ncbi:MAG TPA: hypothetical protein VFT49_02800 [Candidatus Saccharimonadales bacterium]|nr:hypothetical protein [Candidatus Saccharimonadales bacterium]
MKIQLSKKSTITLSNKEVQNLASFTVAVLVAVFCLLGSKTLLSKALYQQRAISAGNKASKQLDANLTRAALLSTQYSSLFENTDPQNVLGGKNDSSAQAIPPNIDNARIAIDALPTMYDYPATLASITKILTDDGIGSPNITGTDQTSTIKNDPLANPQPVAISLGITGSGNYASIQNVLKDLERSIRPFDVTSLQLAGTENNLSLNANVTTYFQPAKTLGITPEAIK